MWSEEQHYFQGGYDYDFIKELDHRLECSICLLCMRDPYKTSCGHIFCYSCILTWINEGRKCPHDNSSLGEGVSKSSYPDQPYIICKVCQKIVLKLIGFLDNIMRMYNVHINPAHCGELLFIQKNSPKNSPVYLVYKTPHIAVLVFSPPIYRNVRGLRSCASIFI